MALSKDIRIKFNGAPAFMDYATGTWFTEDCWLDELPAEVQILICQYLAPMVPDYKVYWANVNFVAKTLADNYKAETPMPPDCEMVLHNVRREQRAGCQCVCLVSFFHKVSAIVDPDMDSKYAWAGVGAISDHICNQRRAKQIIDAWAGPGHYEKLMVVPYVHSPTAVSEYRVIAESVTAGNKKGKIEGTNPIWVCLQKSASCKDYHVMDSHSARLAVSPNEFWDGICETLGCYQEATRTHGLARDDPYWFVERHDSPSMEGHLWGQVYKSVYQKGIMNTIAYWNVNKKQYENKCQCVTGKGKICGCQTKNYWKFDTAMSCRAHLGLEIDYELLRMRRELAVLGKVGKKPLPFHMTKATYPGNNQLPACIDFCGKHQKSLKLFESDPKTALVKHIKTYGYSFNKHGYVVYKPVSK